MLFDFLLAETALQRGDQDIAIRIYLKLAKNDPRSACRATCDRNSASIAPASTGPGSSKDLDRT